MDFNSLNSMNDKLIYSIVNSIRKYISHYLKEFYYNPTIGINQNAYIAIDEESLFSNYMNNDKFG